MRSTKYRLVEADKLENVSVAEGEWAIIEGTPRNHEVIFQHNSKLITEKKFIEIKLCALGERWKDIESKLSPDLSKEDIQKNWLKVCQL